jgi:hypothetical protein
VGRSPVEAECELAQVGVRCCRARPPRCVPSTHRFTSEATRWTPGILMCAGSPLRVRDHAHPNTPEPDALRLLAVAEPFDRDCLDRLVGAAPAIAGRDAADVALIYLHDAAEQVGAGLRRRPSDLVQDDPRRVVAAEPKCRLDALRTDSALLARDESDRVEPLTQADPRSLEDCSGDHRGLPLTSPGSITSSACSSDTTAATRSTNPFSGSAAAWSASGDCAAVRD